MKNENRLRYLKILNEKLERKEIKKKKYKKEIKWIRKNIRI